MDYAHLTPPHWLNRKVATSPGVIVTAVAKSPVLDQFVGLLCAGSSCAPELAVWRAHATVREPRGKVCSYEYELLLRLSLVSARFSSGFMYQP